MEFTHAPQQIDALAVFVKAQIWSKERPTQNGWYWAYTEDLNVTRVVCVFIQNFPDDPNPEQLFEFTPYPRRLSDSIFTHWMGPLTQPQPPNE